MVDFLYGMNLRKFSVEKWVKISKTDIFWAKIA